MGTGTYDMAQHYERTAGTLPATELPAFYDDAARELIRNGDSKRGATMFANARAAEAAPGAVPVAHDTWLELHREFAALGALSTKSVADFVKALKTRATPDVALDTLAQVAIRRAHAGQAPWPQLPKQLSVFAKAAGRDEVAVHRDLLEQLLAAESVAESAAAMWTAWQPILIRVCAESARVRGLLLNLLPVPESLDGWWLELLDECGALAGLGLDSGVADSPAEPGAEPRGGRAAWLERTIWHPNLNVVLRRRSRVSKLLPPQISDLIERMAPALRADGVPVRLEGPDYWTKRMDVRVLETCLTHGIPLAPLSGEAWLDLRLWMYGRRPEDDLVATIEHPGFGPQILDWVKKGDAAQLWAVPALRPYLRLPENALDAPHPLDGPKIYSAVHEFGQISAWSGRAVPRPLYSLRVLTKTLREGTAASIDPADVQLGETADLAGRVEWIVLRAVAHSTPPDRRELLTALLEVWGESVLADPATRVFHGTADYPHERTLVGDEHGVAMRTLYARESPKPFMALTGGSAGVEPPRLGPVEAVVEMSVGWGTAERLRQLVALLRERGGVPRDPAAAAALAAETGMSLPAAAMALAGLLGCTGYNGTPVTSEERKALGIAAKQVEPGREELSEVRGRLRTDVLLGILPDEPAELWQPGGLVALAERLAGNWVAQVGRGGASVSAATATA